MRNIFYTLLFISCLMQPYFVTAANNLILPPPNIDQKEQVEFIQWRESYLNKISNTPTNNHSNKPSINPIYVNKLALSQSPYLTLHETNPINWKPWSQSLLQKAKKNNKLIFLSIGYSSCHWCHIMNSESFRSVEIAELINHNFYAIKVDREELPHIDDYYMSALKMLKQEGGWPITAIIDSNGLPIFLDSYLSKSKLKKLLTKISLLWESQPEFLLSSAKNLNSLLKNASTPVTISKNNNKIKITNELLEKTNSQLIPLLDFNYGGFTGDAKFPSEAMLLYALDQLNRKQNKPLENLVKLQLDNMINSPLYDHISGGFHRYSTQPDWTTPHFEKTLYNQAQLILVYAKAYEYFNEDKYYNTIQQTADFLIDDLLIKDKGFMSSIDADYSGKEGYYYLFNPSTIDKLEISEHLFKSYQIENSKRLGITFLPPSNENERKQIQIARTKLLNSRKMQSPPNHDNKIILGWNGLAIKALVIAGKTLHNKELIKQADLVANQLWNTRIDTATGLIKRNEYGQFKDRVYLADYAYLADSYIALYDISNDHQWLERANYLAEQATKYFESMSGETYNSSTKDDLFASKKSADAELLSPYSVFLSVKSKLDKRSNTTRRLRINNKQINHLISRVKQQPTAHLADAKTLSDVVLGVTENSQYFARNNGKFEFKCTKQIKSYCMNMDLKIKLKSGWHINSNKPLQDHLIATEIVPNNNLITVYPNSSEITLGFQEEAISVFTDSFKIKIKNPNNKTEKLYLKLLVQACNDKLCLLPEQLLFTM